MATENTEQLPSNIEDVTIEMTKSKKQRKRARKQEKKEEKKQKKKQMKLDIEQMKNDDMDQGLVVSNDDIQYDIAKYDEYKQKMNGPIDIMNSLMTIDDDGRLYFQGQLQDTDNNHNVNRHVIKTLMNEIHEDMGQEGQQRMVNLKGRHSFDSEPLTNTQNQHKNMYVRRLRQLILDKSVFNDEELYKPFDHNGGKLYLKYKGRKPRVNKGVHFEEKAKMEAEMEKNKDLGQKVIELEAENSVLRQKREDVGPHNPTMANRPEIVPEIEPLKSQVLNVDAVTQRAQPGPYQPDWMPLYRSPNLHYIQSLFYQDRNNYKKEQDNAIFGKLFNPANDPYAGVYY